MNALIRVLERSTDKHGANTPVTLGHLLNIAKMSYLLEVQEEEQEFLYEQEASDIALGKTYDNG